MSVEVIGIILGVVVGVCGLFGGAGVSYGMLKGGMKNYPTYNETESTVDRRLKPVWDKIDKLAEQGEQTRLDIAKIAGYIGGKEENINK